MRNVYELTHQKPVEIDEDINQTKLLGFFSSEEKCQEAISHYLKQPGVGQYPDDFVIEIIEADIDDHNDIPGEFEGYVYYFSHEWYDGEYDYVSYLGYYSSDKKAKEAEDKYRLEPEFTEYPDGFWIEKHKIDQI